MIVGAYQLDCYCDTDKPERPYKMPITPENWDKYHEYNQFPESFIGRSRGECMRAARRAGWRFTRHGKALCPKCSGKRTFHSDKRYRAVVDMNGQEADYDYLPPDYIGLIAVDRENLADGMDVVGAAARSAASYEDALGKARTVLKEWKEADCREIKGQPPAPPED